ncbi:MAG: ketoacyl-ACP synthase III [Candidatus Omnitrophica bacterium]|nr:ketoacyl-ACP synthase III [Candidatus Omnitrophota bacterium]
MSTKLKRQRRVGIIGTGYYLPPRKLTNADLEKLVKTTDEWITTRTGIKERRIADDDVAVSDLAVEAAERALKKAKLKAEDVELLIVATITPDMLFPSTACMVQAKLGLTKAACFDISAACSGFIYAIATAEKFIKAGAYKNAVVVGGEKLSCITDWKDRSTCILFGDGAGACVLGPVRSGGILSTHLGSDGKSAGLLELPAGGSRMPASKETVKNRLHYLKMSGSELFKIAVRVMAGAANKAIEMAGLKCSQIDCIIPHQANIRILNAVAKKIGLGPDKVYLNIERYGNMSSASTAVALAEAVERRRIKKGDIVVLDAFGAGLTWGAIVIKW